MDLAGQRLALGQPGRPLAGPDGLLGGRLELARRTLQQARDQADGPAGDGEVQRPAGQVEQHRRLLAGQVDAVEKLAGGQRDPQHQPGGDAAADAPGRPPGDGGRHRVAGGEVRPLADGAGRHDQPGDQVEDDGQGQVGASTGHTGRGRATVSHPVQTTSTATMTTASAGRRSSPAVRASTTIHPRLTHRNARIPSDSTARPRSASDGPRPAPAAGAVNGDRRPIRRRPAGPRLGRVRSRLWRRPPPGRGWRSGPRPPRGTGGG